MKPIALVCFFFLSLVAVAQREEQVTDSTAERVLKGTLLWPAQKTETVVLIIAGSGPTDRDGNNPRLKSNYQKWLAEGLAQQGLATFRYDKRGVGGSTMSNPSEAAVTFTDFVLDAVDLIRKFKADKRFARVLVLGHSEGSLIGMLAIQHERVAGFISAAGLGRPVDVVLKEQLKSNPYNPPALIEQSTEIIDSLKNGHPVKMISPLLQPLFRPSVQPFLISFMKFDPALEMAKLNVPVQILQGTTDIQVTVQDAERLKAAKPDAQLAIIAGMNHVFREAPAERMANMATYTQAEMPVMPAAIEAIAKFIKTLK